MAQTIRHNLAISCEKPQSAALQSKVRMGRTAVLPIRTFFMSAPHLMTFDKKLGCGANFVVIREFREFNEFKVFVI